MTDHVVEVQIDEQYEGQIAPETLMATAEAVLAHVDLVGRSELTVVLTSDEVLHELNMRYRGVDAPTDVLAFADETQGPFVEAPGLPRYLGDVIISMPRAEAQAVVAGHGVQAELQLLVAHGVLHLLGFDDAEVEARARMWSAQAGVLRSLGVDVHLPD